VDQVQVHVLQLQVPEKINIEELQSRVSINKLIYVCLKRDVSY
jgi:hypothetical protein